MYLHNRIKLPNAVKVCLKPFEYIAVISYPLYLIHQNVGYGFIRHMQRMNINDNIILAVTCCIMVFIGALIHYLWEVPVVRFLRTRKNGENL